VSVVDIRVDGETAVGHIMLNRPEKRNALSDEMRTLLFDAVESFGRREDVSCILLYGAGPTFCAGHDIVESTSRRTPEQRTPIPDWKHLKEDTAKLKLLRDAPVPVVIAIQGHCYGMATLMSMFADIVVVAEDAKIGAARMGGGAGYLGPPMQFLSSGRKAREIELRFGQITGKQAEAMGWANYAVPTGELQAFAQDLAEDVARQPRDLLEIRKASMNFVQDLQGFSQAVESVALWDMLGHFSPSAQQMFANLASDGLSSVI
jgi:enoyl-CoA hydratase